MWDYDLSSYSRELDVSRLVLVLFFLCSIVVPSYLCFGSNKPSSRPTSKTAARPVSKPTSIPHTNPVFVPTLLKKLAVGKDYGCRVAEKGSLVCWGKFPKADEIKKFPHPVTIPKTGGFTDVDGAKDYLCGVCRGKVECFSYSAGRSFIKGIENAIAVRVYSEMHPNGRGPDLFTGYGCALLRSGEFRCWSTRKWEDWQKSWRIKFRKPLFQVSSFRYVLGSLEFRFGQSQFRKATFRKQMKVGALHNNLCSLDAKGKIRCRAKNSGWVSWLGPGKLKLFEYASAYRYLKSGWQYRFYACGLSQQDELWCAGFAEGRWSKPIKVNTGIVRSLDLNDRKGCILRGDGKVFCWKNKRK